MTPPISNQMSKNIKHIGLRPKNDQDNPYREKLCQYLKDTGCFYEICPEQFYLVYLAKGEKIDTLDSAAENDPACPFIIWSDLDEPELAYEPFNMDFGPFNLAVTHQFCSRIKIWLDTRIHRDSDKVIVIVLHDYKTKKKLNVTLLVAIAAMVLFKMTDQEVIQRLNFFMMYKGLIGEASKQLVFREKKKFSDVSGNQSLLVLGLEDCIQAFYAALQNKFYDYYNFDQTEYLFYETVMSGDLNWIIPGKILGFAGPCHSSNSNKNPPSFYYHYFKDHNVTSIVRLNDPEYDSDDFTKMGFHHHDLIFPDGYPPTSPIAAKFIKIVDEAPGAVAVHCYAGIGRTGTLIAAYLMARYNFTAQMAIAWTRICRPGSVIGEQQDWLYTKFDPSSVSKCCNTPGGRQLKTRKNRTSQMSTLPMGQVEMITSPDIKTCPPTPVTRQQAKTTYAVDERTLGQAKALQLTKKRRENPDRPNTRNHSIVKRNSFDGDTSGSSNKEIDATVASAPTTAISSSKVQAVDVVLDLGKTIPLSLNLAELLPLQGRANPEIYSFLDYKYKWRVKFPEPGYVTLRHNFDRDVELVKMQALEPSQLAGEPSIEFRYEHAESCSSTTWDDKSITDVKRIPKLEPVAYFTVL